MTVMLFVCLLGFCVASLTDSDARRQQFRTDVIAALDRANWCGEAVSEQIGISSARLSKQLNGHEPMTFLARAHALDGFWREFVLLHAERYGLVILQHTDLQQLVAEVQGMRKSMAKMTLGKERKAETA